MTAEKINPVEPELLLTHPQFLIFGAHVVLSGSLVAKVIGFRGNNENELTQDQSLRVRSLIATASQVDALKSIEPGKFELFVHFHDEGGDLQGTARPSILGITLKPGSIWFITD